MPHQIQRADELEDPKEVPKDPAGRQQRELENVPSCLPLPSPLPVSLSPPPPSLLIQLLTLVFPRSRILPSSWHKLYIEMLSARQEAEGGRRRRRREIRAAVADRKTQDSQDDFMYKLDQYRGRARISMTTH
eukprot:746410-Hanusia_phi.AAC.3